jgi:hypothetical protein
MPWCPNCKYEFVDGIEQCNHCGIDLVDELENENSKNIDVDKNTNLNSEQDKEALLFSAKNELEANIIESKLRPYNIPVWKKGTVAKK